MAKILVVDDSEMVRGQLKKVLSDAGYQVLDAGDGVQGMEVLAGNKDVSLIFCDVNMPRMDGVTMCKKVHANADLARIPIFMLTTESNPEMKVQGKEVGVVAWITKPFVDDKLLAAVSKVLSGAAA